MAKKAEYAKQLREKTPDELDVVIVDLEKNIQSLSIEAGFGRLDNVRSVRYARLQLAQAKTIRKELS